MVTPIQHDNPTLPVPTEVEKDMTKLQLNMRQRCVFMIAEVVIEFLTLFWRNTIRREIIAKFYFPPSDTPPVREKYD